jgi:quercetin dioxygenase-like cupin family protein
MHDFRNYQGGYFKTLLSPEQSGGEMAVLDLVLPKGAEPPPHIHEKEDESFYVLEGIIDFYIAGKLTRIAAGEFIFAPRNVPHYFKIISETSRIITIMTPGDLWNYFMEFSEPCKGEPATTPMQPRNQEELVQMAKRISSRYAIRLLVP